MVCWQTVFFQFPHSHQCCRAARKCARPGATGVTMRARDFFVGTFLFVFIATVDVRTGFADPQAAENADAAAAAVTDAPLPQLTGAQVSIPWQELKDLIEKSRPSEGEKPPVAFVFTNAEAHVVVSGNRATAEFAATLQTFDDGWTLVPLGPEDAGVVSADADGEPAPLVVHEKNICMLLSGRANARLRWTVETTLSQSTQGEQFRVPLPPAAIVSVAATLPRADLHVETEGAAASRIERVKDHTTVIARYRGGQSAMVRFRDEDRQARPPRIYAEVSSVALVDDGLVRIRTQIQAQVLHSPAESLRLGVGSPEVVLDVRGENVARWTEEGKGKDRALIVHFVKPILGDATFDVLTEVDTPDKDVTVALEAVRVLDARRQQGYLAVAGKGGMQFAPKDTVIPRVSVSQLPVAVRDLVEQSLQLAYRYAEAPASVALEISRPAPQPAKIFADTATLVSVLPQGLRCRAHVHYEILHAGVDTMRVALPEDVELLSVDAPSLRTKSIVVENGQRLLVMDLSDLVRGDYEMTLTYLKRVKPDAADVAVPLLRHPDASTDRGMVGVEVRGSFEVTPTAEGLQRIDVKELPGQLWQSSQSPLLLGYRSDTPEGSLSLALTRHQDLDVLVAVSDVCEASTVVTTDGKCITKMMYIVRNNMKPFMTLKLPEGAQVWSALVDDRPVTPAANGKGEVLIPLRKSEEVEDDDEDSYRAQREKRRRTKINEPEVLEDRIHRLKEIEEYDAPRDLKPYDVEIVFVLPSVELADRGELNVQLPECDIPTGHLAWAVFTPDRLRVVDAVGQRQGGGGLQLAVSALRRGEVSSAAPGRSPDGGAIGAGPGAARRVGQASGRAGGLVQGRGSAAGAGRNSHHRRDSPVREIPRCRRDPADESAVPSKGGVTVSDFGSRISDRSRRRAAWYAKSSISNLKSAV